MDITESTKKYLEPVERPKDIFLQVGMSEEYENWFEVKVIKRDDPFGFIPGNLWQFPKRALEVRYSRRTQKEYVAATDSTALLFHHAWGDEGIEFMDEESEVTYKFLLTRFHAQTGRAETQAKWKLEGDEVAFLPGYRDNPDLPLADYQRIALNLSQGIDGYALFMDKGTGKTATSIMRAMHDTLVHHKEQRLYRILIVCPNQVRVNWQEEFKRFSTLPGKVTVMRGGHIRRVKQLTHAIRDTYPEKRWTALVTGYDTVRAEEELLMRVPWDLVVLDESHYIRNRNTKRSKALMNLREQSDCRLILTGSPIANSPMDLWAQLEFLGQGQSGFMDFKNFANFFGKWHDTGEGSGIKKLVGLKNVPLLQERLSRISFQVTKEQAGLNLPDKVYDVIEVEMTPKQQEMYTKLAEQLKVEIEFDLANTTMQKSMQVNHVLTKLLRLAQITSGYIKWDPKINLDTGELEQEAEVERFAENPKIEAMLELLAETDPDCKVIVWTRFRENIAAISEALTENGYEHGCYYGSTSQDKREEYKNAFNKDPNFKVLVANPATAAEGLDLLGYDKTNPDSMTTYCGLEIFFNSGWSAVERSQAEDRAHRRGTRMPVQITDIIVPGTIDEEIRNRVLGKLEMADLTLNIDSILEHVLQ